MSSSLRDIKKEDVRLLAIELNGVRKAARRIGQENGWTPEEINRFEDRVCQWSKRDKWFPKKHTQSPGQASVSSVSNVSDILVNELSEHESATRLSLAKSARRMAQQAETADLRNSPDVHNVAKTMAIVHKQDEGKAAHFSLNILSLGDLAIDVDAGAADDKPGVSG